MEVDILPGNRRNSSKPRHLSGFSCGFFDLKQTRQQSRIVVNDAIRNQSTAFIPDQLFTFSLEPQGAKIGIRNCSVQLMIAFSAIHSPLDILPQGQRIDIVEEVERTENIIQLPKRPLGAVFAYVRTQFTDNDKLGCCF